MAQGRFFLVALVAVVWAGGIAQAGGKGTVGKQVSATQRVPVGKVEHAKWSQLLARYVDAHGDVNYGGWQKSPQDFLALDEYLEILSSAKLAGGTREELLAFWINAYNAVTVKGILREYPTDSIRNHTAKVFGYNIWKELLLPVDGRMYSLEQIEHDVLRKQDEPRIHFAIVCASVGCPKLRNEAYVASRLDEQLTANTKDFFTNRGKFQYDSQRRTIEISPILNWFAEDFGANQADQLRKISPYLPDEASRRLANSGQASVSFLDYDWSLNDQARHRKAAP